MASLEPDAAERRIASATPILSVVGLRTCYRPDLTCSLRAIVSSVTANSRMMPVTV
jgi:hypothetical protein